MAYLKLYIVVRNDVPNNMVPVLVAHSMLGAHLHFYEHIEEYDQWLTESFRKVIVSCTPDYFDKLKEFSDVYLGHENKTLDGVKSCAIPIPVWSDKVPDLLKYLPLWNPNV